MRPFRGPPILRLLDLYAFIIELYKAKKNFVGCESFTMRSGSHASENANQ